MARAAVALTCATAVAVLAATPASADQIREDQWHLGYLRVAEAHKISQGEGVTVAVIDTGVDPHSDLRQNLLSGVDVVSGGAGNGQGGSDSHGTEIAGLIGAHGKSGDNGALGIAPKAKIFPIRYKTDSKTGDADSIADGILAAVNHGAKVINISLSGGPSTRLRAAVEKAISADVVVIAGSGNKPEYSIGFPASYSGVVAVGATTPTGAHADISLTGRQLAISAPGVDIWSTSKGGKYAKGTGTSNATAIVAGAAALVRSKFPQLSAEEVVHRLTATAVDKGAPGRDEVYGYGVLDLVAALTADVPPLGDGPGASPLASARPTVVGPAGPDNAEPGDRTASLLIAFGTLVVLGIVGGWLFLRARRRRADGAG